MAHLLSQPCTYPDAPAHHTITRTRDGHPVHICSDVPAQQEWIDALLLSRVAIDNPTLCARFHEKFIVDDKSGCWIWRAATSEGYGSIYYDRRVQGAHRAAYELYVGPIPAGMQIDHLCRNPACVNPGHLEVVTLEENVMRGQSPAAIHARKTHCIKGHPLSGDNLYVNPNRTRRHCRECRAASARRTWARIKAERQAAKDGNER